MSRTRFMLSALAAVFACIAAFLPTQATVAQTSDQPVAAKVNVTIKGNFDCSTIPNKTMKGVVKYDDLVFKRWFLLGGEACWTVKDTVKGSSSDWDIESYREKSDGTKMKSKLAHFDDMHKVGGIVQFPEGGTGHVFVWATPNGEADVRFIAINLGAPMPSSQ